MIYAGTGHRPDKLGGHTKEVFNALVGHAQKGLDLLRPDGMISGMALGWDQAVAVACVRLGIPFVAAVPFEGFDSRWPRVSRDDYQKLLLCADQVHVVCNRQQVEDAGVPWALQERNCWMVDNSQAMFALWNGDRHGGTWNCIQYARQGNRQIINSWGGWVHWWESGEYLI
jgi:uncharacterized phage-like protein YoqJ